MKGRKRKFYGGALVLRPKKMMKGIAVVGILSVLLPHCTLSLSPTATRELLQKAVVALCLPNPQPSESFRERLLGGSIAFALAPKEEAPLSPDVNRPQTEESSPAPSRTIESTGLTLRNQTSYTPDTASLVNAPLSFLPLSKKKQPQVLIVHTHTSEGYHPTGRSSEEDKNVVAVGAQIAAVLEEQGIAVLHDKTVHDENYNGSYDRSLQTVTKQLDAHPELCVVLDVHRDALTAEDGTELRLTSEINGKTAAQYMLVMGTDEGGLEHPDWQTNLSFALRLQQQMDTLSPGLARPINLRKERFNQHMSPGMILVEAGASGNTLEEALYSARLFADALSRVLKDN